MYKVEKVKSLFDCDLCHETLVDPIALPCGNSVCKRHVDELLEKEPDKTFLECEICHVEHIIPKEGFMVNKRMQECLNIQLNTLKLLPVYDECKEVIRIAKENVAKIEKLETSAENYIYEYFEDIKRQVDLRREDLKAKIDKYSDETIQSIESSQLSYIKLSKEANRLAENIDKSKKELDEFVTGFDTFQIDEKKFATIKQNVSDLNDKFKGIISEYHDSLLGNKEYSLKFNGFNVAQTFGCLFVDSIFDSAILDKRYLQSKLNQLCGFPKTQKWELIYRGTRDGFGSQAMMKKQNYGKTITVIKSSNGNIFGGYKEGARGQNGVLDHNDFIFSLINKDDKPFKAKFVQNPNFNSNYGANCQYSTIGNSFGHISVNSGLDTYNDISISEGSNTNENSCSNFGYSYHHPDYQKGTQEAKSILAGSYRFKTVEIEAFTKVN